MGPLQHLYSILLYSGTGQLSPTWERFASATLCFSLFAPTGNSMIIIACSPARQYGSNSRETQQTLAGLVTRLVEIFRPLQKAPPPRTCMVLLCRVDISGQYRSVELVYEGAVYQPGHQPPVHRQPRPRHTHLAASFV